MKIYVTTWMFQPNEKVNIDERASMLQEAVEEAYSFLPKGKARRNSLHVFAVPEYFWGKADTLNRVHSKTTISHVKAMCGTITRKHRSLLLFAGTIVYGKCRPGGKMVEKLNTRYKEHYTTIRSRRQDPYITKLLKGVANARTESFQESTDETLKDTLWFKNKALIFYGNHVYEYDKVYDNYDELDKNYASAEPPSRDSTWDYSGILLTGKPSTVKTFEFVPGNRSPRLSNADLPTEVADLSIGIEICADHFSNSLCNHNDLDIHAVVSSSIELNVDSRGNVVGEHLKEGGLLIQADPKDENTVYKKIDNKMVLVKKIDSVVMHKGRLTTWNTAEIDDSLVSSSTKPGPSASTKSGFTSAASHSLGGFKSASRLPSPSGLPGFTSAGKLNLGGFKSASRLPSSSGLPGFTSAANLNSGGFKSASSLINKKENKGDG